MRALVMRLRVGALKDDHRARKELLALAGQQHHDESYDMFSDMRAEDERLLAELRSAEHCGTDNGDA